jgi:hypothetical protein
VGATQTTFACACANRWRARSLERRRCRLSYRGVGGRFATAGDVVAHLVFDELFEETTALLAFSFGRGKRMVLTMAAIASR